MLYDGATSEQLNYKTQEWADQGVDLARLSGALASALAGGDADDVGLGSMLGGTAAANNALSLLAQATKEVSDQQSELLEEVVTNGEDCLGGGGDILCNGGLFGGGGAGGGGGRGLSAGKSKAQLSKKQINTKDLLKAGQKLDKNGLTKAGRALQKHGDRAGSKFPQVKGSAKNKNEQGQKILNEILSSKNLKITNKPKGIKHYRDLDTGRGVAYNKDGTLRGFLD